MSQSDKSDNKPARRNMFGLKSNDYMLSGMVASAAIHLFILVPLIIVWEEDSVREVDVFSVSIVAGESAPTRARVADTALQDMQEQEKKKEPVVANSDLGLKGLSDQKTATPTPTSTPTRRKPTYTATPKPSPTVVATATSTPRPTATSVPTSTKMPTATPRPQPTATLKPTRTPVPATPTPRKTATPVAKKKKLKKVIQRTSEEKPPEIENKKEETRNEVSKSSEKSVDYDLQYTKNIEKYLGPDSGGEASGDDSYGSAGSAGVGGEVRPRSYFSYMRTLQSELRSAWTWHTRRTSLSAEIEMRIARDGTIVFAQIAKGSGNREFDMSVMRAIRSVDPFPAPPREVYKYFKHVIFIFDPSG